MNYTEFVEAVSVTTGQPREVVNSVFSGMKSVIVESVSNLEAVQLWGLLTLQPKVRFGGLNFAKDQQDTGVLCLKMIVSSKMKEAARALFSQRFVSDN